MKQIVVFTILVGGLSIASCKEDGNKMQEQPASTNINASSSLGQKETKDLLRLIDNYYILKDALVATDANKADIAAKNCITNIGDIAKTISLDSTNQYQNILLILSDAEIALATMVNVKDESTEQKRIQFEIISDALYDLIKTAKIKNVTIYRQYCPMAFNDQGAYWLSNDNEIRNPYFGDKMLECGEIAEVIE